MSVFEESVDPFDINLFSPLYSASSAEFSEITFAPLNQPDDPGVNVQAVENCSSIKTCKTLPNGQNNEVTSNADNNKLKKGKKPKDRPIDKMTFECVDCLSIEENCHNLKNHLCLEANNRFNSEDFQKIQQKLEAINNLNLNLRPRIGKNIIDGTRGYKIRLFHNAHVTKSVKFLILKKVTNLSADISCSTCICIKCKFEMASYEDMKKHICLLSLPAQRIEELRIFCNLRKMSWKKAVCLGDHGYKQLIYYKVCKNILKIEFCLFWHVQNHCIICKEIQNAYGTSKASHKQSAPSKLIEVYGVDAISFHDAVLRYEAGIEITLPICCFTTKTSTNVLNSTDKATTQSTKHVPAFGSAVYQLVTGGSGQAVEKETPSSAPPLDEAAEEIPSNLKSNTAPFGLLKTAFEEEIEPIIITDSD